MGETIREEALSGIAHRARLNQPTLSRRLTPADFKVLLGIPMERTIGQRAFFGFADILVQGWPLAQQDYTRNDIARCNLAEYLLQSEYTHLLMLDSDHVHPSDIVDRLARWFIVYPDQVQVVGGLNFRRGEPYDPCAFIDPGDGSFRRMAEWCKPDEEPGAIEVDALGSGSIMIERKVFEQIDRPFFGYDYSIEGWPGTDMWFSAKCRKAGIKLWCDTSTTSPHISDQLIDGETWKAWMRANGVME